ncbi:transglutaminaseTgpA domain-containing protein [Dokdonella sp.]|uniref:transglutaminase family protein n=1 Tax=Dokdonella sp. TaxID=2291710 RepID=UPI003C5C01A8
MRLSTHQFNLLAITALLAVLAHAARLPPWLIAVLALIAPLRMISRSRGGKPISAWWRVPMVAALFAAIILHYGNFFGREPGSALACGLLMLKLLESERIRDARAALGFSAFVLMSALLSTQTISFTLVLCASLILLLASLNALQPAPVEPSRPLRGELRTGALLFALGLPLALAAFLFIPRLGSPLWGSPGAADEARTGLSDSMSPGSMTELLIDDTPALRATFNGPPPAPSKRYFRAIVLWDFDGRTWSREDGFPQRVLEPVDAIAEEVIQEITLEPTDRPWLVALDVPLETPERTRMTRDRTLIGRNRNSQIRQYSVRSAIDYRLASALEDSDRKRALQLPEGFNPDAVALADRWRDADPRPSSIVNRALELFGEQFTYTLVAPPLGRNSVDDFLFNTRAGYCEHFSSAFVFLMRAAGIPARVVTGYQGGWWNEAGSYLLVRQSDAHAWAEVWLQDRGWVRIDPTAAVNPARIEVGGSSANGEQAWFGNAWLLEMRNQFDLVNRMWTQTIVQFNALRQKSLLAPIGISEARQGDLLLALSIVVTIVLLIATAWVMRSGKKRDADALDKAWNQFRRKVSRHGIPPRLDEGPLAWLIRMKLEIEDPGTRTRAEQIVRLYVQLRYAQSVAEKTQISSLSREIREFRLQGKVRKQRQRVRTAAEE